MPTSNVKADPEKPIDFNIIPQSPHVVAFRVWARESAASDWRKIHDGSSQGNQHKDIGKVPVGGGVAYWIGVGGNASTEYRVVVALGQDGKLLPDGTFTETGMTGSDGSADDEREMTIT
jgi:hypothetical protein